MKKRVLSLALAALMLLALLPTGAFADYTQEPAQTGWDDPTGNSTTENAQMFRLLPTDITADPPTTLRQAELFEYWEDSEWTLEQSKESVFQEIVTMVENLTKGKATETEKAEAIFYWVTYNIDYDEACYTTGRTWQMGNAFYTFARRKGVCEGYARLSTLMMTIAGLPTAYIPGEARNGGLHAWNAVLADGRWIMFDATWDKWDISADYHNKINYITYVADGCKIYINDSKEVTLSGFLDKENYPSELVIPDSVTSIGAFAFEDCTSLTSVTIGNSVTSIGNYAFNDCTSLTTVTIPDSVTSIGKDAFNGCTNLTTVTIPGSVTSIGAFAFRDCTSLTSVTIGDSVTSIGDSAFRECTNLTSVTIGNSVTSIGDYAFRDCTSLTAVTIPDSVTSIGDYAFKDCTNLTFASIGNSVTSIGSEAFSGCESLKSVTISNSVKSIGRHAFSGCICLTSVTIPDSVTMIGHGAFLDCKSLTTMTIPDSVTKIGRGAFSGCSSLTSMTIPSSMTSIWQSVFYRCTGLTSVTIPNSVTDIASSTFSCCSSLSDIYYGGSEAQWKAIKIGSDNAPLTRAKIHYNSAVAAAPTAYPSTQNILVDGKKVEFPCYALKDANGNDTNYVKLRDVASVLSGTAAQFDVGWNGAVNIETGKAYTSNGSEMSTPFSGDRIYKKASSGTKINGFGVNLDAIVLTDDAGNGYTYYKLRDLGAWLGFKVDWSAEKGIFIETK